MRKHPASRRASPFYFLPSQREKPERPTHTGVMKLFSFFVQELAIDLGTANTLIIQDGKIRCG
jgi:hypothetical protein